MLVVVAALGGVSRVARRCAITTRRHALNDERSPAPSPPCLGGILIVDIRELISALAALSAVHHLNQLAADAVVVAELLGADLVVSQDTSTVRQAVTAEGSATGCPRRDGVPDVGLGHDMAVADDDSLLP